MDIVYFQTLYKIAILNVNFFLEEKVQEYVYNPI